MLDAFAARVRAGSWALLFLQLFFGREALQSACGAAGSYPIPAAGLCLALAELPEVLVSPFPGLSKFP